MANSSSNGYSVGILVISDTVSIGEKEDHSGKNLEQILKKGEYFLVNAVVAGCVADDLDVIKCILKKWADKSKLDLILTVGGTGFSDRDITPEATKAVIQKEAIHIASYMIMNCAAKAKYAVLSRSTCGIRGTSLILNLPGSKKGSEECFEMVASVLPHAMDQLKKDTVKVVSKHVEIQGGINDRSLKPI